MWQEVHILNKKSAVKDKKCDNNRKQPVRGPVWGLWLVATNHFLFCPSGAVSADSAPHRRDGRVAGQQAKKCEEGGEKMKMRKSSD